MAAYPAAYLETSGSLTDAIERAPGETDSNSRHLKVLYKAPEAKFGSVALLIFAPFWAVWLPYATYTFAQGQWLTDPNMLAIVSLCLTIISLSVLAVCVCLDNKIDLRASGFRLPSLFLLQMSFYTARPWRAIRWIRFLDKSGAPSTDPEVVLITLSSLEEVALPVSGFEPEGFNFFFEAIQAYAPHVEIFPPLHDLKFLKFQRDLGRGVEHSGDSFTRLWQDDLAGRFASTTFVPLEPGTKLQSGRAKVISQLAFGGLSAVYLADCDGRLVTLKEAFTSEGSDAEEDPARIKAAEMFKREAELLKGLNHKRIAKVFDHFSENGRQYIVLEHIIGKDLRRFVRENGCLPEPVALRWCAEAADILTYMHALSPPILHRDLTPDNLVLERDGSVTLIDFGAANAFLGTVTGTLIGKQSYISPEQFRGKASPVSDIYALGATLFFLLTGVDPQPLSCSRPSKLRANISQETDDLVAACTALDTEGRLESAVQVAQAARMIYCRDVIADGANARD